MKAYLSKSVCTVQRRKPFILPADSAHTVTRALARGVVLLKNLLPRLCEVLCVFDLTDRDALVGIIILQHRF